MLDAYTQLFRLRLTPETVLGALGLVGDVDGLHVARKAAIEFFVANANLVTVRREIHLVLNLCTCRTVGD